METQLSLLLVLIVLVGWFLIYLWKGFRGGVDQKISSPRQHRGKQPLQEQHAETILKFLQKMTAQDRSYYVENCVRDCIAEIARIEGKSNVAPGYREWLSQWERRGDLPQEYLELASHLKERFRQWHEELMQKKKELEEQANKEKEMALEKECDKLLAENKDVVDKLLEITERKVSILDDYGDENWDALPREIDTCIRKIAQREGLEAECVAWQRGRKKGDLFSMFRIPQRYLRLEQRLPELFREYHQRNKASSSAEAELDNLSGTEFESYVAGILKESGYQDVRGTPTTGDQGADLIAKKDGKSIVIQAKRYQGAVGNKAVQEVMGAVSFYGADEGWVVTNATFTPSAKALAQKSDIKLLDGNALAKMKGRHN